MELWCRRSRNSENGPIEMSHSSVFLREEEGSGRDRVPTKSERKGDGVHFHHTGVH